MCTTCDCAATVHKLNNPWHVFNVAGMNVTTFVTLQLAQVIIALVSAASNASRNVEASALSST